MDLDNDRRTVILYNVSTKTMQWETIQLMLQSSAVMTRSDITWYCIEVAEAGINHGLNWTHKIHHASYGVYFVRIWEKWPLYNGTALYYAMCLRLSLKPIESFHTPRAFSHYIDVIMDDGVSNHQPHHCLLNRLFRRRSKKTSKLHVTGLCVENSPVTGEFPAQMVSNAENVSIDNAIMVTHPDHFFIVHLSYSRKKN